MNGSADQVGEQDTRTPCSKTLEAPPMSPPSPEGDASHRWCVSLRGCGRTGPMRLVVVVVAAAAAAATADAAVVAGAVVIGVIIIF